MKPRGISDSFYKRYESRPAKPTPGMGDANPVCGGCNLMRADAQFRSNGTRWRYCAWAG